MSAMQSLILAVQGESAERSGLRREQVFDCCDGSIGRSDECDWVLGAEGVSRLHAQVRYLNGLYFIEDRSTNGMLLNGTSLRKGDPAALKHGDRLQIDAFEIGVRLTGETQTRWQGVAPGNAAASASAPLSEPGPGASAFHAPQAARTPAAAPVLNSDSRDLSLLFAPRRTDASAEAGHGEGLIPGAADARAPGASLDPLALFDAPSSYFDEAPPAASAAPAWNHTPALSDRFQPPPVEPAQSGKPGQPAGPVLPDDWDVTGSRVAPRAEPSSDDSSKEPSWDNSPNEPALVPHSSSPVTPSQTADGLSASTHSYPSEPEAIAPQVEPPSQQDAAALPVEPAVVAASTPPSAVAADPAAPDLNDMFHIAVDSMMDVLRARAELKNSFRLPATLIQRSENNPLKFAPTAQEAVRKLFAPPDNGFLSGSAALNEAADDIRNHQMAMLAGVRSAFQSLLEHFDPARIEQESEGSARRLSLGGRPRHWERYKAQFDALTRNPDECFRRLFGDEFARAYEDQLARLKSRRP
jgi:predicted component of type VI protein secretion system